jgi:hypothetical protein
VFFGHAFLAMTPTAAVAIAQLKKEERCASPGGSSSLPISVPKTPVGSVPKGSLPASVAQSPMPGALPPSPVIKGQFDVIVVLWEGPFSQASTSWMQA